MQQKFALKGMDKLEKEANKLIKEVNQAKTKILQGNVKIVRAAIKRAAPVGRTTKTEKKRIKNATYAMVIPPSMTNRRAYGYAGIRPRKAPHAHLVERGHGGPHPAPAHPFFWRAIDSVMDQVRNNIPKELKKVIEG